MAWKIRKITGSRRLTEDLAIEATRVIEYMVDNPTDVSHPFGPFLIELPATMTEAEMRARIDADAQQITGLASGG